MPHLLVVFTSALVVLGARHSFGQDVSRAFCGQDGRAHVMYRQGGVRTPTAEPKQVGCEHITAAADGRTIGWSVLVENCCTSYSIPTSVVVYCDGRRTIISPGQMVWEWRFIDEGKRVAVLSGPVHGEPTVASLYDAHSGKTIEMWAGEGTAPNWATEWDHQFPKRH